MILTTEQENCMFSLIMRWDGDPESLLRKVREIGLSKDHIIAYAQAIGDPSLAAIFSNYPEQ